ncbi:hypothetical protein [Streptomyces sp. NPDC047108]|uniref:hypothetical protein n=1 Tax=Streptomyces sp. NPDC047108 TaxID=3155025 RepID=UPI0033F22B63
MNDREVSALHRAAARAALSAPGVRDLQPGLRHQLAAAVRGGHGTHSPTAPPEAGIRTVHTHDPPGWHVEVRCIVDESRRVLDTARDVRERVRAAVTDHLAGRDEPGRVDVLVSITRTEPV